MTDVHAYAANPDDEDVFIYTTGSIVPNDVVRVRVHPSVTIIPKKAFYLCTKLMEVELSDGLQTIGKGAFYECRVLKRIKIPSTVTIIDDLAFNHCGKLEEVELREGLHTIGQSAFDLCGSLRHINLPTTIRTIGDRAFADEKSLLAISLPNGIESIGSYALMHGRFFTLRIPPLITTIPQGMAEHAVSLFSLELSESVTHLRRYAFARCGSLRNLAIPPNTSIENDHGWEFCQCLDLQQLFRSSARIIDALKHRFDNLPIHKMLYYQSYESVTLDQLNDATNMRSGQSRLRSKLDPTGKRQDCLGMTPLHILACSTVQNLELYKVLIEKYPENLITEDRWGTLPLLYAVWGNAPLEIVQYLVERYQSIYPEYEFNWTEMVETLGSANVPTEVIQKLVDLQKEYFPKQNIGWGRLLESVIDTYRVWDETFGYLVQFSLAKRIDAIGLKQWRDDIKEATENCYQDNGFLSRQDFITEVKTKLAHYETKYHNLKEATSLLELALWKQKMNDHVLGEKKRHRKKTKIDESSIREQCRISCGADIVIQHMLPYLVCPPIAPSSQDDSNSDHHSSSESDDEIHDESDDESTRDGY